jgi:hypothetical protein
MNRRAFLGTLAAATAGLALDPERLLWRTGQKSIFLPAAKPSLWSSSVLTVGDMFTIEGTYSVNPATGRETGIPQNYVITANVESGDIDPRLICPAMHFDGLYRNVHGVLVPKARVTPVMCGHVIPTTVSWLDA